MRLLQQIKIVVKAYKSVHHEPTGILLLITKTNETSTRTSNMYLYSRILLHYLYLWDDSVLTSSNEVVWRKFLFHQRFRLYRRHRLMDSSPRSPWNILFGILVNINVIYNERQSPSALPPCSSIPTASSLDYRTANSILWTSVYGIPGVGLPTIFWNWYNINPSASDSQPCRHILPGGPIYISMKVILNSLFAIR